MRVLELNDAGLRISDARHVLVESPGYAALDGKRLLIGHAAGALLRIDPRRCHDRYWYQLDAALPAPMAEARSAADLAHAHLRSLGEALTAEPLLVAAPASFTPAQLGVLLGLLQALGARAVGLFDPAVAAASRAETQSQVVHVDVQLHRFVLTVLRGNATLDRQRVQEHKPGLVAVHDRCAAVFAQAFVRQTRFDPLHSARTEQLLYDQLPSWLAQLANAQSAVVELESGGRSYRATVDTDDLATALSERLRELAEDLSQITRAQPSTVLLSARAALVPGLAAALTPAFTLDDHAPVQGALEHLAQIRSDTPDLPWVTRLPRRAASSASNAGVKDVLATHVLVGHRALPLPAAGQPTALASWLAGAPGLVIRGTDELRLEAAQGSSVRVNGQPAQAVQVLNLGDRISAGGVDVRLIHVPA